MQVTVKNDLVRHWFIEGMQISLLAATDALALLDRLGPSIGLDISVNALHRLGRMLIDQPGINPLLYDNAVDPELRHLFRLPPSMALNAPSGFNFSLWPISSAWAKSSNDRLYLWVPTKKELPKYLPVQKTARIETVRSDYMSYNFINSAVTPRLSFC